MGQTTHYVPGSAVLLVGHGRWALVNDPGRAEVLESLWSVLQRPGNIAEAFLTLIDQIPALTDAVLVDESGGTRERVLHGSGRSVTQETAEILTLSDLTEHAPVLWVSGGVVRADSARLPVARTGSGTDQPTAPAEEPSFIDGIPAEILAARAPDGPPAGYRLPRPEPTPDPLESTQEVTGTAPGSDSRTELEDTFDTGLGARSRTFESTDPTEHTQISRRRRNGYPEASEHGPTVSRERGGSAAGARTDHLVSAQAQPISAVWCPQGHPGPPSAARCRICRAPIAPQESRKIARPVLGGLRLPTGEVVPVDRSIVVGRRAAPLPGGDDWPHLVHLGAEYGFVSRLHLQIVLDGWQVLAQDLGSRGGTVLTVPGQDPIQLGTGEYYALEPGSLLDLAGVYSMRFEVGEERG